MSTPVGVVDIDSGDFTFCFHNGLWYTDDGRWDFLLAIDTDADVSAALYMFEFDAWFFPVGMTIEAIMTTIILYALGVYLVLSLIDNRYLNLLSDLLMLVFFVLSLIAFFSFHNAWAGSFDYNVPVFSIVSGLLAIIGLVFSGIELSKK